MGNRALGDRLPARARPLAALWTLMSPFVPMLFMGEEYGEQRPFQFFTDHIDPFIADATREGRRNEFADFAGFEGEVPDPQDPATAARSVLDQASGDPALRSLYRRLIALRAELPRTDASVTSDAERGWIALDRGPVTVVGNFLEEPSQVPVGEGRELVLATSPEAALDGGLLGLPALSGAVLR